MYANQTALKAKILEDLSPETSDIDVHCASGLPPLALQRESRPVIRRFPPFIAPHLDLRGPQGRRRALSLDERLAVKLRHQFRRRLIVHIPQADQHASRARV